MQIEQAPGHKKTSNKSQAIDSYEWILFDADDTLFHFDSREGLRLMLARYGRDLSEDDYNQYEALNKQLWAAYQRGEIDAAQIQEQRFSKWGAELNVAPELLNQTFLDCMSEICEPLPGAQHLVEAVSSRVRIGVITNGFAQIQKARLEKTGLLRFISVLVISEEVGVAKPHPAIFDHALRAMGNPDPARVLMVGDNPTSDIVGGESAGMHTCWLNHRDAALPPGIRASFEVGSLPELQLRLGLLENVLKENICLTSA